MKPFLQHLLTHRANPLTRLKRIALFSLLITLSACSFPDSGEDESHSDDGMATVQVTIPGLASTAKGAFKAASSSTVPEEVTSLLIEVFNQQQRLLASADVINRNGRATLTIAAGSNYTIRGTARAGSELLFRGETTVATLAVGSRTAVSLTLADQVTLSVTPPQDLPVATAAVDFGFNLSGLVDTTLDWYINGTLGGSATVGFITAMGRYTPPVTLPANPLITVRVEPRVSPSFAQTFNLNLLPAANIPPTADAGADQTISSGGTLTLNATNSLDPDGTIVTYLWALVSEELYPQLANANSASTLLTAPSTQYGGIAIYQLTVTDNQGATGSDTVTLTINGFDQPLQADAGVDQVVVENTQVTLDGSGSHDPDNIISHYLWQELSNGGLLLSDNSAQRPTFTAPSAVSSREYQFSLTVTNDRGEQAEDSVTITVNNSQPPGKLFFAASTNSTDYYLWVTDGTTDGTQQAAAVTVFNGDFYQYKTIAGSLFFQSRDLTNGRELWRSDGTPGGTVMLPSAADADYIGQGAAASANPSAFNALGDRLIYAASTSFDGTFNYRQMLSLDTRDNSLITVFNQSPGSYYPNEVGTLNGYSYFFSRTYTPTLSATLYKTDGINPAIALKTVQGYTDIKDFVELNGELYFASSENGLYNLWKTDGSSANTVKLHDFSGGVGSLSPYVSSSQKNMIALNNRLYFLAHNGGTNKELWVSDGTATGTTLLKELDAPATDFTTPSLHRVNNRLLFLSAGPDAASDGLWASDGTTAGTQQLANLQLNSDLGYYEGAETGIAQFVASLGLLFFSADDGVNGNELWVSDGTIAGTRLVKDIYPGALSSQPAMFQSGEGYLLFIAVDESGRAKLWRSDGSEAGTTLIKDIDPTGFEHFSFFRPAG